MNTISTDPRVGPALSWVSEGQKVWAPRHDGHYILCTVAVAAGDHARLTNPRFEFEAWRPVRDCFAFRPAEGDAVGAKPTTG